MMKEKDPTFNLLLNSRNPTANWSQELQNEMKRRGLCVSCGISSIVKKTLFGIKRRTDHQCYKQNLCICCYKGSISSNKSALSTTKEAAKQAQIRQNEQMKELDDSSINQSRILPRINDHEVRLDASTTSSLPSSSSSSSSSMLSNTTSRRGGMCREWSTSTPKS